MEVIIWTTKGVDLDDVSHVLMENPVNNRLNEFAVEVRKGDKFDAHFFLGFSSSIVQAKSRPQHHIVILDGQIVQNNSVPSLIRTFECMIDQVKNHPMKCLIFYDLNNVIPGEYRMSKMRDVIFAIRSLIEPCSPILRYCQHGGTSISLGTQPNGALSRLTLTILAKALVTLIRQHANLK